MTKVNPVNKEEYPQSQCFDGIAVPIFARPRQQIRDNFKIRAETDIIVATYQKSGTTWTQNILRHLLWPEDTSNKVLADRVPWLSYPSPTFTEIEAMVNPRVFKTHDPAQWIDDIVAGTRAKIVFVYRSARDVAVSYYKHMSLHPRMSASFQNFYRDMFRDPARCSHGLWEDHLAGYLAQRSTRNMLVLRFEDMKEDLPREIRKIAEFIGVEAKEELVQRIAEKTDFSYMKNDITCNYSHFYKHSEFMRCGKVGAWRGYLTEEQARDLEEVEKRIYEEFGV